jgi:hypothetical protein
MAVAKSLYVGQFSYFGDHATFNGDVVGSNFRNRTAGSIALESVDGETLLTLPQFTDSVNYVAIYPSVTNSPPHIIAQGTDANIGLHLQAKGTGFVNIQDGTDTTKRLRFGASGNSPNVITTLASSSTTSQTITLPNATGATTLAGLQMTQAFTQVNTFSNSTASTSSGTGALLVTGGIGVALVTDATSSTNGGAMTIAGGLAVAKKLYVGGTLTFSGHILPSLDNAYDIGQSASPRIRDIYCVGTATMQNVKCAENVFAGNYQDLSNVIAFFKIGQDSTHSFFFTNRTASASKVVLSIGTQDATQTADLFHCYQNSVVKFAVSTAGTITLAGGVVFGSYTVSTFPSTTYFEAVVTDALVPVVGSVVASGGSAKCKVMYNGSAKIVTAVL